MFSRSPRVFRNILIFYLFLVSFSSADCRTLAKLSKYNGNRGEYEAYAMLYEDNVAYAQFTDNKQQRSTVCVTACVCDVYVCVFVGL